MEDLYHHFIDAIIANDAARVQNFIDDGMDPNITLDDSQVTPLHHAAQNNALLVVPILMQAGSELDVSTTPDGQTPVDVALMHGHEKMVKLLMAYNRPQGLH